MSDSAASQEDTGNEATPEALKDEQAERLINEALAKIKRDYSTLPYHNAHHTEGVQWTAEKLMYHKKIVQEINSIYAKLNQQGHPLAQDEKTFKKIVERSVRLAATCHDDDQTTDPQSPGYVDQNERSSMKSLREEMEKSREQGVVFSEDEIRLATLPIRATVAKPSPMPLQDDTRIIQSVERLETELQDDPLKELIVLIAKILCDADLSKLGGQWHHDYVLAMWAYFMETQQRKKPTETLDFTGAAEALRLLLAWREYLKLQSRILENHRYYTEAAKDPDNNQSLANGLVRNAGTIKVILENSDRIEAFFRARQKGKSYHPAIDTLTKQPDENGKNGGKTRVNQIGPKRD